MKFTKKIHCVPGLLAIFLLGMLIHPSARAEEADIPAKKNKTWAEKLGFPAGKKVIILHADDAGMSEGANIATAHYLKNKYIQSTAIMAPCPAADEFIQWAIDHPEEDVGMHLTHTSEWKTYRWDRFPIRQRSLD